MEVRSSLFFGAVVEGLRTSNLLPERCQLLRTLGEHGSEAVYRKVAMVDACSTLVPLARRSSRSETLIERLFSAADLSLLDNDVGHYSEVWLSWRHYESW